MKKLNMAEGILIFLGMLLILGGVVLKLSGINVVEPMINKVESYFIAANTCFLLTFIIHRFGSND